MASVKMKVIRPTIGQLIEFLQKFPSDKPLRLLDADTGWTIPVIHIEQREEAVWLYGIYDEMRNDIEWSGPVYR